MSSHHIIREKQEPALLILEIASFDEELFGQLLEWSPTVIVSEAVYEHVLSLGIKIDVLLKQSETVFETQEHVKICNVDGGNSIKSAMTFLTQEEYPSVNVIVKSFNAHDFSGFVNSLDIVIFTADKKIFPIKDGFKKWKPEGESIFILSEDVKITSIEGLILEEKNQYKTIKDGFYRLGFSNDFIFLGEEL